MEIIQQWYTNLTAIEQFFWTIALIASTVFLVQAVLTLIGMDSDYDFDFADGDTMDMGGALSLFSIRSIVNFFVGFGWCGVSMIGSTENTFLIYAVSVLAGIAFTSMYLFLRRKLKGLESDGSLNMTDCLGMEGSVYLRIPARKKGKGKIQVSVNGSIHEFDAVTQGEQIPTGELVKIVALEGNTPVVAKCQE